ncbi:protein phosphatase 2C-related protein [Heterostelium album PN500]|uniref:Protein phosphatase 2C-related protein n=1 Tax=Heterostelium pallidum (strain ATCC 26659 / Pp 5 / PN500) TaxID=670386 RepID=D3B865_HETP5|nr:protein phosphatase 2C-related protein [Heterostelium album PN500]EFA82233.1 protein phosphatase 2C-related protein [Heterostelium album PN500]|eukprot:XP_020434350.1 protein phosphatase 2C-related protein [Heterostelium album PN500]
MNVLLKEDEVEILESKLRDPTSGIIPKLSGDDQIRACDIVDWLITSMPISRSKATEYGQMLWNRGVFDHIAPGFADNDQQFRLKPSEISPRRSVDEQQWNQLRQDSAQKDTASADPIAKLHKSIENATKVYQRLLREKNQLAPPNMLLGLKLLDQTLNLITSSGDNSVAHPGYSQILYLLANPDSVAESGAAEVDADTEDQSSFTPQPYTKKLPAIPESKQKSQQEEDTEVVEALSVSEKLEAGLIEQLSLAQQQTNLLKQLLNKTTANPTTASTTSVASQASASTSANDKQIVSPTIQSVAYPNSSFDESPISLQRSISNYMGLLKGIDLAPVVIGSVENKFPKFLIADPRNDSFIFTVNGPMPDQLESSIHSCFNNNFYARTVSTYPHLPGHPKREGDPICDHFSIQMQANRVIAAIADGCNWGVRPQEAALKASTSFVDFISKALSSEIQTVQDAGNHILSAFNFAHNKIIEGKSDIWEAGTTTLLGGVMVELVGGNDTATTTTASPPLQSHPSSQTTPYASPPSNNNTLASSVSTSSLASSVFNHPTSSHSPISSSSNSSPPSPPISSESNNNNNFTNFLSRSVPNAKDLSKNSAAREPAPSKWGFICASVGDCKAFHYNHTNKKFTDITKNNRGNVDDPKDPGGRLGPYVANGHPDLRNLCLHFLPCQENDIIILLSDGVHDNLDPHTIGVSPRECGMPHDHWSDMDVEKAQDSKSKYMQEFLKKKLRPTPDEPIHPKNIVEKLIEHCVETTRSSREFMVAYPHKPLPDDLKAYPGKMDHTTCIAFKVGKQSL